MTQPMYIQTCKTCGLKQSATYEHQTECFGACDSKTKKMRSHEEITGRIRQLKFRNLPQDIFQINVLKWVIGEIEL